MKSGINLEKENALLAANKTLHETIKNFPFGSNNIISSLGLFANVKTSITKKSVDALIDDNLNAILEKNLSNIRQEVKDLIAQTKGMERKQRLPFIKNYLAKKAALHGIGNCEELTAFAFLNLIENKYPGKIEVISFQNKDHIFIVLNRPEKSQACNWATWGKEAIVLDPWINQVFTADKFEIIWKENPWNISPQSIKTRFEYDDNFFRSTQTIEPAKSSLKINRFN